jgi:hypothetical protein
MLYIYIFSNKFDLNQATFVFSHYSLKLTLSAIMGGTEVEHLPRHLKFKGLSPAMAAGNNRENMN